MSTGYFIGALIRVIYGVPCWKHWCCLFRCRAQVYFNSRKNIFMHVLFLAGSKAAKSFSFPSVLSLHINCTTFSTGEHIVALYIGILTI